MAKSGQLCDRCCQNCGANANLGQHITQYAQETIDECPWYLLSKMFDIREFNRNILVRYKSPVSGKLFSSAKYAFLFVLHHYKSATLIIFQLLINSINL